VLDRIALSNFRNHRRTELSGTTQFNLMVGENGAGKTNVLEALSLLSPGRGLRRASLAELPGPDGQGAFQIGVSLFGQGHEIARLGTFTETERPGRRLVRVNGSHASAKSLGEWLAISWLTPAMDGLFMDSAGARRRYMDRLILALDPSHARYVSRYDSALRERNRLLAEGRNATWLDAIEAQVAKYGAAIAANRAALASTLADALTALPDTPFAKPNLTYLAIGPTQRAELHSELARTRGRDRAAGRTLTGPHRDELDVVMAANGRPAASCSTGEQKAMLISLTLAHAALAAEDRPGILLLDVVAAHLDPVRRSALFERLSKSTAQVWLTGAEPGAFEDILNEAAVWRVFGGSVAKL